MICNRESEKKTENMQGHSVGSNIDCRWLENEKWFGRTENENGQKL